MVFLYPSSHYLGITRTCTRVDTPVRWMAGGATQQPLCLSYLGQTADPA
jgi:hypothetical protein